MDVLDTKDDEDYNSDLLKYIELFSLHNVESQLKGSSQFKYLKYTSDYDIQCFVKRSTPVAEFYNSLRNVLLKIEQEKNLYFIELKYQTSDDLKIRFHPSDFYGIADLERHYDNISFVKLDTLGYIGNRFYEITCFYSFRDDMEENKQQVIHDFNNDVDEYIMDKFYFKALKRLFSIAIIQNNREMIEHLMTFL